MRGAPGIAAYLAEIARLFRAPWALGGARRWIVEAEDFIRTCPEPFGPKLGYELPFEEGLLTGRAGVGWARVMVSDAAGDRAERAKAIAALGEASVTASDAGDLCASRPAFGEAARALLEEIDHVDARERAVLLEMVSRGEDAAYRAATGPFEELEYLTMAHGYAGMLFVLLRTERYGSFALARVAELATLGVRSADGLFCLPSRPGGRFPEALSDSWCNGATGYLKLYVRANRVKSSPLLRQTAIALGETVACLPSGVPGLCCGNAGRALALMDLAEDVPKVAPWRRRARALLRSAIARTSRSPSNLFIGRAGIAWANLCASRPDARRPLLFAP
jgi:serine/threonine-protein kinase